MIAVFIPVEGSNPVARRTVNLPDSLDALVRELSLEGESFSAAVTRLIDAGVRSLDSTTAPSYVGAGQNPSAPDDLGIRAEEYLRDLASSR